MEFALHDGFKQDQSESNINLGMNVVFPQELTGDAPLTVPCFSADQLTITLAEMSGGKKLGIVALRFGNSGLLIDYEKKENIDRLIEGLQRLRDLL